ncbi:PD-(D/E)XK nuclease family protein [Aliiroseovarius sp.]|uniref:PDDEXK-like family protein n=1 Tax=Aliiroseovarius sp. TaxID=1872442 RepID=UPI003BACA6CE
MKQVTDSAKIELVLAATDAQGFKAVEKRVGVFCPFEAIGMVHQEIRHSTFLAYCLDPKNPHGFGDRLLREFLRLVVAVAPDESPNALDLSRLQFDRAEILREWRRIDLLIRIPTLHGKANELIIAVEQKIHAVEGKGQLERYRTLLNESFPGADIRLIFLPKDETMPQGDEVEYWGLLSLKTVVDKLAPVVRGELCDVSGAELFAQYVAMLRRHIMPDTELERTIRQLWRDHGAALELLMEYRPDLEREVIEALEADSDKLTVSLPDRKGTLAFSKDDSAGRFLRFCVDTWDDKPHMRAGDGTWAKSKRLLMIELQVQNQTALTKLVLGPGDTAARQALFDVLSAAGSGIKVGGRKNFLSAKWKIFASKQLLSKTSFSNHNQDGKAPSEIAEKIAMEFARYWERHLPKVQKALEDAWGVVGQQTSSHPPDSRL